MAPVVIFFGTFPVKYFLAPLILSNNEANELRLMSIGKRWCQDSDEFEWKANIPWLSNKINTAILSWVCGWLEDVVELRFIWGWGWEEVELKLN